MTDQERVLKLLEEGKISKEEAEGLLSALDETDTAAVTSDQSNLERLRNLDKEHFPAGLSQILGSINQGIEPRTTKMIEARVQKVLDKFDIPAPPMPPFPPEPETVVSDFASRLLPPELPSELQWVRVVSAAGDVTVRVDPTLITPVAEGDEGPVPITTETNKGSLTVTTLNEDLELTLPENFGVFLDVKSGNVDVEGCFVIGKVLSGDVRLEAVTGVILTALSGDVDANLLLSEGKHAINVLSGDADVTLLAGSSVKVQGTSRTGDIHVDTSKSKNASFTFSGKRRFVATVGEAAAHLELSALSGDLSLEVDDE